MINDTSLNRFMGVYRKQLHRAMTLHFKLYSWPVSRTDALATKMREAILRGSFDKNSHSFKWTCKELGIPHTYTAIREFITTQQ